MRPVTIERHPYLDGGLVSPTNADVLDDVDYGLVVIVSPMSGRHSTSAVGRVSSGHARRRLGSELKQLRARQPVLVIEPSDELSALVVDAALDTEHTRRILTASFLASSQQA
jgi:NTE family protein